ncbi:MAG TPA: hypothetical protein VKR31_16690 [Rhizomicrobium sp.]|nr:hypothetical protein [Rhizomicrobium sp.]
MTRVPFKADMLNTIRRSLAEKVHETLATLYSGAPRGKLCRIGTAHARAGVAVRYRHDPDLRR